jgi:hypothetical protein
MYTLLAGLAKAPGMRYNRPRMRKGTRLLGIGGAALLAVLAAPGCKHPDSDYYLPRSWGQKSPPASGSIEELSRRERARQRQLNPAAADTIVLLVAHDAAGKPVAVEVRQSSGDTELDARAREWVLTKRRFPAGKADTVVLSLLARSVPR